MPPVMTNSFVISAVVEHQHSLIGWEAYALGVGGGIALLSMIVNFVIARRRGATGRRGALWALNGLLFGIAGVVLLLCMVPRLTRIGCHRCGKLRRICLDECEHCGASRSSERDGIEVFDKELEFVPAAALGEV